MIKMFQDENPRAKLFLFLEKEDMQLALLYSANRVV